MRHPRVQREKRIINLMIKDFCEEVHGERELCDDCVELRDYAEKKLVKCPFLKNKPVCSKCSVHCYNSIKREEIKEVMRTIGPKMLFRYPFETLWYLFYKLSHINQKVT